jgi:hypothetical protein
MHCFGPDSEALAREENQRAERRLEASVNEKRGDSDNDPAKHPVDVLASFVQTFTEPEDIDEKQLWWKKVWEKNQVDLEDCGLLDE